MVDKLANSKLKVINAINELESVLNELNNDVINEAISHMYPFKNSLDEELIDFKTKITKVVNDIYLYQQTIEVMNEKSVE